MPFKAHIPALIVVALMGAAAAFVPRLEREGAVLPRSVRVELPPSVGDWQGQNILFCQNERCGQSFVEGTLADPSKCPVCGAALSPTAVAEKAVLPADTIIARKRYTNAAGEAVLVSVVVSGREQKSIHRPEQCMPAQGLVIERSTVFGAPLAGRQDLALMGLELRDTAAGTPALRPGAFFAYWFASNGQETPYHFQRLYWMSLDRVLRGRAEPWLYVSLLTDRVGAGSDEPRARIRRFLTQFYPVLKTSGVL